MACSPCLAGFLLPQNPCSLTLFSACLKYLGAFGLKQVEI